MIAAKTKTRPRSETRLLVVDRGELSYVPFQNIVEYFRAGDLLVINDAATLPASFSGTLRSSGKAIEVRLAASRSEDKNNPSHWYAICFGAGDWRTPTELRPLPPELHEGDLIHVPENLMARVERVLAPTGRFIQLEFLGPVESLWRRMYRAGKPVQYSHLREDLKLWDIQTIFAGAPVSLEPPSAAFPLSWEILGELEKRGVNVVSLTHAAGLSSTGDADLDAQLPLPERYWIPPKTAEAVNESLTNGGRVIAVGTTVTRALESAARGGRVVSGGGTATLKISPDYRRQIVSGILSGFHDTGASHLKLLGSFIRPEKLAAAYREAEERGFLAHEFGDANLIIGELLPAERVHFPDGVTVDRRELIVDGEAIKKGAIALAGNRRKA